ncbi:MAG: DNA-binding protein [Ruminococcus sp.]|nr:DNA-binding protein [Ruminococcus sp.]
MAKELKFVLLLDCYGELLTEHQRNVMELYYCEDLSLSEIGNPLGITRQAVRALIKRTELLLLNYEEKLGFADKIGRMRNCFGTLREAASTVNDSSVREKLISEIDRGLTLL